jgi:N-acetylneuraminate synthase
MTIDLKTDIFCISDKENLWKGKTLYQLYEEAYTPWEWHEPIFKKCEELGLVAFSTPFDETAVDFLEQINVPAYKIASFENNHIPLIKKVAKTGKPMIISTGMASIAEMDEMVKTAREGGCKDIILLKCTSTYPATPEESNLKTIPHLKELFKVQVGLSDHTMGIGVSIASVALGVTVIEKHFTLSRAEGGIDAAFSMEPTEMKLLVEESLKAWHSLGTVFYGVSKNEKKSTIYKRSIYVVEDIQSGESLSEKNLKIIRPGDGLEPKFYETVIGKKVSCPLKKGTPLKWEFVG